MTSQEQGHLVQDYDKGIITGQKTEQVLARCGEYGGSLTLKIDQPCDLAIHFWVCMKRN